MALNKKDLNRIIGSNFSKLPNRLNELFKEYKLRGSAPHVFLELLVARDDFHPSIGLIMENTGLGERTVRRGLHDLEKATLISRAGKTRYGAYKYAFNLSLISRYCESAEPRYQNGSDPLHSAQPLQDRENKESLSSEDLQNHEQTLSTLDEEAKVAAKRLFEQSKKSGEEK